MSKQIFTWDNFDKIYASLLGTPNSDYTYSESAFGGMHIIKADDTTCSGRLEFYKLSTGMLVTVIDCVWFDTHSIHILDRDWIRFNFSLSIDVDMHLSEDKSVKIIRPSWRIINYPENEVVVEEILANKRSAWVTVCCKKDLIEEATQDNFDNLPNLLQEQLPLSDEESFHDYHEFTARLNAITADILKTRLSGAMRTAYIGSRGMELICHALDHLLHSSSSLRGVKLSEKDDQKLGQAHDILVRDFASPPSIAGLSRELGINRNKLFYGFKKKFGYSVSEFIQSQRLEEGKRLLQHTDLPISDIAEQIGFNHQSNFTTAMKRHFGLTPKQFRA